MNKNKGFTLIELLVVIAIIGILASVVLASLSSARNKGKDAAVKSQLANMRAQAELYYSANEAFYMAADNNVCTDDSTANGFGGTGGLLAAIITSEGVEVAATAQTAIADIGTAGDVTCHATNAAAAGPVDQWAVEAPLTEVVSGSAIPANNGKNIMYCVDSSGASRPTEVPMLANATACL